MRIKVRKQNNAIVHGCRDACQKKVEKKTNVNKYGCSVDQHRFKQQPWATVISMTSERNILTFASLYSVGLMLEKTVERELGLEKGGQWWQKGPKWHHRYIFFPYVFTYLLMSRISILFRSSAMDSHLPFSNCLKPQQNHLLHLPDIWMYTFLIS